MKTQLPPHLSKNLSASAEGREAKSSNASAPQQDAEVQRRLAAQAELNQLKAQQAQ